MTRIINPAQQGYDTGAATIAERPPTYPKCLRVNDWRTRRLFPMAASEMPVAAADTGSSGRRGRDHSVGNSGEVALEGTDCFAV